MTMSLCRAKCDISLSLSLCARNRTAFQAKWPFFLCNNRVPAILIKYNVYIDTKLR